MNLYDFYERQNSKYLATEELLTLLFSKSSEDAAKHPPLFLDGDDPITVCVGGREERWGSRWLCYRFYKQAALELDGKREGKRYRQILAGLLEGASIPSDGIPLHGKSA